MIHSVIIRHLGLQHYSDCWQNMQQFTRERDENTPDEIWILEHYPIFTQGQNGKPEHLLATGDIPVIQVDRGGQVTYHGPGQLVAYTLVDLKRKNLNIREMVSILEQSVIDLLKEYGIFGVAKREAPGVYINNKKICSIGLRVRRGCVYHGLAFNIAMDLSPFARINPCGFKQLPMTQLTEFLSEMHMPIAQAKLIDHLTRHLRYTSQITKSGLPYAGER